MTHKTYEGWNVSVIMPAYQSSQTIQCALKSVAEQTEMPLEVIVVDDGSDDGTFEMAMKMKEAMASVELHVFRQKNQGAGAARNQAMEHARGEILAFLDADDYWLPAKLEISLRHMNRMSAILVAHDFISEDENGDQQYIACAKRFSEASNPYRMLYRKGNIGCSTTLLLASAAHDAGYMDISLRTAQDFDLWLKVLGPWSRQFHIFGDALTVYRVSDRGITGNTERRLACTYRIAKRHLPFVRRNGGGWYDYGLRVLAIHMEAMRTYRRRRQLIRIIWTCMRLIGRLVALPVYVWR